MSKPAHRIKTAHALRPFVLHVEWANGGESEIDLAATIKGVKFFAPLADAGFFMRASAGEWGWNVVWPDAIDMAADRLMVLAMEQSGKAANARFREWLAAHHLTLAQAAQAIGVTSRTISQYSSGARPVPRTVTLACKGWELEQNQAKRGRAVKSSAIAHSA
jgi:DNA-binding XRE family transcriptional regulator